MGLLISAEELASLSDWVIFDCRFSLMDPDMGRNQYTQAHIPDARYADLNLD
ncbi:MAG: sulfurtransferase, partial [Gammaproteobacteria bacterium]|nr:sulfurtransferase [Gammaproteobacteria bacterium]